VVGRHPREDRGGERQREEVIDSLLLTLSFSFGFSRSPLYVPSAPSVPLDHQRGPHRLGHIRLPDQTRSVSGFAAPVKGPGHGLPPPVPFTFCRAVTGRVTSRGGLIEQAYGPDRTGVRTGYDAG